MVNDKLTGENEMFDASDGKDSDARSLNRRDFLKGLGVAGAMASLNMWSLSCSPKLEAIANPLRYYPSRDWEKIYRDQYRYDSNFTFVCSPNDTHACRLRAFVRNGVVVRTEQNYDHHTYGDLQGNKATPHWNPRGCLKGFTIHRRVYGPYRLKHPMVRAGWKQWADDGFPSLSDNPALRAKYKFDSRGMDSFVRLSWDEVNTYLAKALLAIGKTYSGDDGRRRLLGDGYEPEMLTHWGGAGTRTMKFRGGMGLLGVIGKYGLYRFSNTMALVDHHVRKVSPEDALGGRIWSNYTWHGDQAPGMPYVHGLQTSDVDFNDLRHTKLHIQVGKNLVENKMPDSHWFIEMMERGGKIVVIAPEYSAPATKADYWIPIRPGLSDTSIFLYVARYLMDNKLYDEAFVKKFTDLPLLVRTDNLKRLHAAEVFPNYKPGLDPEGPSFKEHHLKKEQYDKLGDYVVFDKRTQSLKPLTRDDVGERLVQKGIDPELEWKGKIKLADGKEVEVMTLWEMYKIHLRDYDLDTVTEITGAPKELIERLAQDMATIKPAAIHIGEGINHWFHATLHNRATYLPLMLTGNIGTHGSGCHTWAGNYKAAIFQGAPEVGPGFKGWVAEDPFHPNLDPNAKPIDIKVKGYARDEEVAYWGHGDTFQVVKTPKQGRKIFTGTSHLPTPTKVMWFTNVNLINNAKWAYHLIKNTNPKIDLIVTQDVEMTASCEYADVILPANFWMEFQALELTASCSNPFIQIWGREGVKSPYDTKDDLHIMTGVVEKLADLTGDNRFRDYWKFALEGREDVYIDRLLNGSLTLKGYTTKDIMSGKLGEPGAALVMFRTYPRVPFYEQVHDNVPFFTDTGRMNAYCDIPEAIEHGENFIVHREGPEATPYLPNVIVSSNPYIRPDNFGITPEMLQRQLLDGELRAVANNKMPWARVKQTKNPLWEQGYRFYFVTPKTRHRVHSQWSACDWNLIWDSNFGDPYRQDKRTPGVGEHQMHMNPQAAKDMGINDGDYVWVDANSHDRPYVGWKPDDPFYKVARCMVRVKFNPAYPYNVVMMKHAPFIATEKSVKAHETRPDGLAVSEDTGYQANFRYGSQQSATRDWFMPMHQTDSLFHKKKAEVGFLFGGEADNHGLNTVPKETLVRVTKAEPGGLDGKGVWAPATTGFTPGNENPDMERYLRGEFVRVKS
jgi:nitrate reductase alpha subunit